MGSVTWARHVRAGVTVFCLSVSGWIWCVERDVRALERVRAKVEKEQVREDVVVVAALSDSPMLSSLTNLGRFTPLMASTSTRSTMMMAVSLLTRFLRLLKRPRSPTMCMSRLMAMKHR